MKKEKPYKFRQVPSVTDHRAITTVPFPFKYKGEWHVLHMSVSDREYAARLMVGVHHKEIPRDRLQDLVTLCLSYMP